MSEKSSETGTLEKIDLVVILQNLIRNFSHSILVMIIVFAMSFGYSYSRGLRTSYSVYQAKVTISVEGGNTFSSSNQATANQLGKVFPFILTSGLLSDIVSADLGYTVSTSSVNVSNIQDTPLLDISVSASSGEQAEAILTSVLENYPEVARYVVGPTSYTIVNPVTVTQTVSTGSRIRQAIMRSAELALLVGILLSLFYSVTYRTIRTANDLRAVSNVHILGTLPIYQKKRRKNAKEAGINILESNVQQSYLESMRQIRTKLLRRMKSHHGQVIMVTSSVAGEGKSTISSNLGISFAQNGSKVLVLDGDIRNPSVQGVLNIKGEYPGITNVIEGKTEVHDAIVSYGTDDVKIDVLLGNKTTTNKIDLLGNEKMKELLEELKQEYDIIILDTAPSGILADAMMVSSYVDGAVYVIMSDYAERNAIVDGMRELNDSGITIFGCVINAGKLRESDYGYKSSYYTASKK